MFETVTNATVLQASFGYDMTNDLKNHTRTGQR